MTAHVSPPKVRYPIKTINGVPPSSSSAQVQQQSISGQQLNDVQNVQSDWIKVVGPNGYPFKGNRLTSNYLPNSQLPPFPPPPPASPTSAGLLPGSYFLSSASQQSSPIYSPSDNKDNLNPSDLKPPPQASLSSSSSSAWSKVYPSGQSGSVLWPNQVKSLA